ncbi:DUF6790 family protein [Francisella uliginis]|uniref:Uncharacterized protein n=1 Tax=Francisella uliginis TaxID=573570 RepID=A0A1L4BPW4_9GAMM|nr:DUF6790 family protein [Francisella uliginis]API85874.1 hypothetical protein F7310_00235 [Francisella uliginis]
MVSKIIEILRISIIVIGGFSVSYIYKDNAVEVLHYDMLIVVLAMSGLSGIEGIFFGQESAKSLARETNHSYQLQSGANSLAVALVGVFIYLKKWGVYADATILLCCLVFFSLSAIIHTWDLLKYKNPSIKNAMRGILMLGLLFWLIPVIYQAV